VHPHSTSHHVFPLTLDERLSLAPIGELPPLPVWNRLFEDFLAVFWQRVLRLVGHVGSFYHLACYHIVFIATLAHCGPTSFCPVISTDLSPVQPQEVPPNLQFEVDDCTLEWLYTKNSFDFIHARSMYTSGVSRTGQHSMTRHCSR
jgi:hypothetical protein